jgi:PAS domain S-box-containing protein
MTIIRGRNAGKIKKATSSLSEKKSAKKTTPSPKKISSEDINNLWPNVFKNSPDATLILAAKEEYIVDANDAFLKHFGFFRKDVIGHRLCDLQIWTDETRWKSLTRKLLQTGNIKDFEINCRDKKGRTTLGRIAAYRITVGKKHFMVTRIQDLFEQKIIDLALQNSEEKFAQAFKYSPIGICISSLEDGRYIDVNDIYLNVLGYTRDELIGRTSTEINLWVDPNDRKKMINELLTTGKVKELELRFRDKQGKIHWGLTSALLITVQGKTYLLTQTNDITDRKIRDEATEKSERFFKQITEHSSDIILIMDDRGTIKYCSPSMERYTGYKIEEMSGKTASAYLHPEDRQRVASYYAVMLKKKGSDLFENSFRILHKDGSIRWFAGTGKVLLDHPDIAGVIMNLRDVTHQKRMEESLRVSEEKYRLLAENVTDAIFITDMNFNYTYVSPSAYSLIGYTPEEFTKMNVAQVVDADTLRRFAGLLAEELEIEKRPDKDIRRSRVLEYEHIRKDGSKIWVETKVTFLRNEQNNPIGLTGVVRDISSRKKAQEAARAEYLFSRLILDSLTVPFFMFDLETGLFFRWNRAFRLACGYSDEEIGKLKPIQLVPDSRRETLLKLAKQFKTKDRLSFEMPVVSKDGKTVPYLLSGNLLAHRGRKYVVGMGIDISDRIRTEELLRQSEEKYRTILEDINEGYFELDLAGNFSFVNNATCRDLGYSREELIGMNNRQYMDKETSQQLFHAFNKLYATGEPIRNLQWQVIRKDGTKAYLEGSISLRKDASGNIIGFRGIAHDITERKEALERLKKSEEQYRLLADHMKDQVWLMDLNLNISYVSPSVEKALGYTFDDLTKIPLADILTPDSFQAAMDFFTTEMPKALAAPVNYVLQRSLELEFILKNRKTAWGEIKFSFIRDENGKPVSILGEGRDITERKQMEEALRKSEENFRRSLDESPLGVRISSINGETIYANRTILDIYGYDTIEELQNTPVEKRYTTESYVEYLARKEKRLRGEPGPSEYEVSIVRKDGEVRHLYAFRKQIDWNGKKQAQVIYQDITLRRQAEEKLNETLESLRQSVKITISVLGTASEAKDPYMAGHQKRVADLARAIATEMKLPNEKIEAIRMAGAIHDIGKISVPSEILCKPAILSDLEFSLIKGHPQYGYEIIKDVESPWPLAAIVHQHHERLDGSGYPLGLKETDILIEARVLAVADVVEAMISYRPYRPALGLKIALEEIEKNAGTLYDRKVVEACLRLFREKNYQIA